MLWHSPAASADSWRGLGFSLREIHRLLHQRINDTGHVSVIRWKPLRQSLAFWPFTWRHIGTRVDAELGAWVEFITATGTSSNRSPTHCLWPSQSRHIRWPNEFLPPNLDESLTSLKRPNWTRLFWWLNSNLRHFSIDLFNSDYNLFESDCANEEAGHTVVTGHLASQLNSDIQLMRRRLWSVSNLRRSRWSARLLFRSAVRQTITTSFLCCHCSRCVGIFHHLFHHAASLQAATASAIDYIFLLPTREIEEQLSFTWLASASFLSNESDGCGRWSSQMASQSEHDVITQTWWRSICSINCGPGWYRSKLAVLGRERGVVHSKKSSYTFPKNSKNPQKI